MIATRLDLPARDQAPGMALGQYPSLEADFDDSARVA